MSGDDLDVLVVGAGVSGLTTAVRLGEAGLRVRIWAAGTDHETTSYAAGATWSPYLVESSDRVRAWSFETLQVLRELAADPDTGIALLAGVEAAREPVEPPEWCDGLDGFRMCLAAELPDGFATGWRFVAPVLDMPSYLGYLRRRAAAAGAGIELRRIRSLADATDAAPVVVNCAGIGARDLVPDPTVVPYRGQIVVVQNPGITEFFVEESEPPLYYLPHGATAILGGTAQEGDFTTTADPDIAAAIVARCSRIEPRLRDARVIGHRVGLRPARPTVRIEWDRDGRVVHNYGHGGAGVTLSWGCANYVTTLLAQGDRLA
jgi:D-amino-acid oxidase